MAQSTNLQRTEIFVNVTQMHITCEKYGGLHLAEPGLTAGRHVFVSVTLLLVII